LRSQCLEGPALCCTVCWGCDVLMRRAVLCCAVLCCAVLCCAVLCCAVLCCAVLCCAVAGYGDLAPKTETGQAFVAVFIFYSIGATRCCTVCVRSQRHGG
jgi:hypothetical protein